MAKAKTLQTKKKVKTFYCHECGNDKKQEDFYKCYTNKSGVVSICKDCFFKSCINDDGKIDKNKMIDALRKIDKPFIESVFIKNINKYDTAKTVIGFYIKDLSLPQYKECTYKDSVYNRNEVQEDVVGLSVSDDYKYTITPDERLRLISKWGDFSDSELIKFEQKYQTMSKSYQILSQMHEESLINVCRLEVFYATALKERNASEIKLFGDLLSKAKQEAKLNPNQLTKNDLSSSGANSFGEIARIVSQRDGILRLPMKYIKQPNDRIDIIIWDLINYNRALKGMKEVSYEEIYGFYLKRIEDFNEEFNADLENGYLGTWEE